MDFNSLLKEIKTINKEKGEKCLICHFPITKNERHYKLKCNHCYHVDCIKMKNGYIKCPYCLSHNLVKSVVYVKNIILIINVRVPMMNLNVKQFSKKVKIR